MPRFDYLTLSKILFLLPLSLLMTLTILLLNNEILQQNLEELEQQPHQQEMVVLLQEAAPNPWRWRQLTASQTARLSKLGRILFLNEKKPMRRGDDANQGRRREYKIVVWKYGPTIHRRHIERFTDKDHDPFETCSVKNCRLSYEDADAADADLIIVHLHRTKNSRDLPKHARRADQLWAFSTDESPLNTFLNGKTILQDFNGIFNWSMHYRMDADIPVPYGRTLIRSSSTKQQINVYAWLSKKKQEVPIAIMSSNCRSSNHRWKYVEELKKHIKIDIYGSCGPLKCAGHFGQDCPELDRYTFYLAFENSNCDEYITEKLWWNAYAKDSIPIVLGATRTNYKQLLPPDSYINVEDFASPRDLARYLKYLLSSPLELGKYLQWKTLYRVHNEHGYFKSVSYHYCRACEALNFNDKSTKIYADLTAYWGSKRHCRKPWDLID